MIGRVPLAELDAALTAGELRDRRTTAIYFRAGDAVSLRSVLAIRALLVRAPWVDAALRRRFDAAVQPLLDGSHRRGLALSRDLAELCDPAVLVDHIADLASGANALAEEDARVLAAYLEARLEIRGPSRAARPPPIASSISIAGRRMSPRASRASMRWRRREHSFAPSGGTCSTTASSRSMPWASCTCRG